MRLNSGILIVGSAYVNLWKLKSLHGRYFRKYKEIINKFINNFNFPTTILIILIAHSLLSIFHRVASILISNKTFTSYLLVFPTLINLCIVPVFRHHSFLFHVSLVLCFYKVLIFIDVLELLFTKRSSTEPPHFLL